MYLLDSVFFSFVPLNHIDYITLHYIMCLLNMQGGKIGQLSDYDSDASPINQSSLCSGAVTNTRDDVNAIWYLRTNPLQKSSQSRIFKYLIKAM